jgi:hypothetical protein
MVMANPFVHIELAITDVAKAKEFYGNLFNWELRWEWTIRLST